MLMRKYVISLLFLFQAVMASAQITQGNWLVGGNLFYSKQKSGGRDGANSKFRTIDIEANAGYFFVDKLAGGLRLSSSFTKDWYFPPVGAPGANHASHHGLGPFLRYYFLKPENIVNLLTDASFTYNLIVNDQNGSTQVQERGAGYSFFAGPVIYFNAAVGMELLLGYKKYAVLDKGIDYYSDAVQFKIGFQIHLDK